MTGDALIVGGTGQIGWAAAQRLLDHGWSVTVASRSGREAPEGAEPVALDREDTDRLLSAASGRDLVVDAVAFTPAHARQLAGLAGAVGSLVVISTASVYLGDNATYLDIATGPEDFPVFPVPITESQPAVDNEEQTYSPLKAAMERVLLGTAGLPVSVLRPGAVHGPRGQAVREWFFVKRALDARPHAVLAYGGESRFGTTATANLAELIRLCAEQPGARLLNAVDPDAPTVREIGEVVFGILGHDAELVGMPGGPRDDLGASPWGVPWPVVLSMALAERDLGYRPVVSYAEGAAATVAAVLDRVGDRDWREVMPRMVERYGADGWFPYDAEDDYVASLSH